MVVLRGQPKPRQSRGDEHWRDKGLTWVLELESLCSRAWFCRPELQLCEDCRDSKKGSEKRNKKGQGERTRAEVALVQVKNKQKMHPGNI